MTCWKGRVETIELRRHMQHKQRSKRIVQKELRKSSHAEPRSDEVDGYHVLYCTGD